MLPTRGFLVREGGLENHYRPFWAYFQLFLPCICAVFLLPLTPYGQLSVDGVNAPFGPLAR